MKTLRREKLGCVPEAVCSHCFTGGVVLFLLDRPRILPFVLPFPDLLSASSCPLVETVRSCKMSQSPSLIVSALLPTFTEEDKDGG